MGGYSSTQKQMSSEEDLDDHEGSSNDEHLDRDEVIGLVNGLENAINEGEVQEAGAIAAQLAQLKLYCKVELIEVEKRVMDSPIKLPVTIEDESGADLRFHVKISLNSSVKDLKQEVETQYGYPCERQSVFFENKLVKEEQSSVCSYNYKSGAVIVIKKVNRNSQEAGTSGKLAKEVMKSVSVRKTEVNADRKRKKSEEKIIGWVCSACTYVNAPHRPGCEICASERPPGYIIPKVAKAEEEERLRREKEQWIAFEKEEERNRNRNWQAYKKLDNQNLVLNTVPFECAICFNEVEVGKGVELRNCLHHFCYECLRESVNACDDVVVKCPYKDDDYACDSVLEEREIRKLVNKETVERLLDRSMATAETTSNDSFHCRTPDCRGWCFYGEGVVNFDCPLCNHDNCIPCSTIHEGQNCKEYQDRLETLARTDEEARKTKEGLEELLRTGEAMRCPKCSVIIIKNGGCDGLSCGNCKVELCWATKGLRWGPKGHGDISGGCRCGVNGTRCHPNCRHCH